MAWKKTIIITLDLILGVYVVLAMTTLDKTGDASPVCKRVTISVSDQTENGFLDDNEIRQILKRKGIYPMDKNMREVDPRLIENVLKRSPFVKTAECYKTVDGHVDISITQRAPVIRIKSDRNDDYYVDENGGIMPNTKYTSDIIIATGNISRSYATNYIAFLADAIMANDMWKNLIEQINILPDQGVEIVPRVGNHIVNIGYLPDIRSRQERRDSIVSFVNRKMTRLEKFYKYGLSQAGWNKYSYINLEFDNQIICKKREVGTIEKETETKQE